MRPVPIAIVTAAAAVLLAAPSVVKAADERGAIEGIVKDAAGAPVAGAFVKLKNDARRLTFMVISQEGGRFAAKDLPAGQYRLQGLGGGTESAWTDNVTVSVAANAQI